MDEYKKTAPAWRFSDAVDGLWLVPGSIAPVNAGFGRDTAFYDRSSWLVVLAADTIFHPPSKNSRFLVG